MAEPVQEHDSLPQHTIPGVSVGVVQALALTVRPLGEQGCSGIFPAKIGSQGLFEGAAEEHCRAGVLLLLAIEVAMPITPRAGEVLADLSVAVGHSGHLRVVQTCGGKFFLTAGGSKAVEPEQGSAVEDDVAALDHALQPYELPFVHLVPSEQFGVVAEVTQEPGQLQQGFRAAIEPARQEVAGKPAGLKNGQSERVVWLLCLPAKLDSLHPNEEDSVGDLVGGTAIGGVQAVDQVFRAAPSLWPR
jgi:hypothetical protein